MPETTTLTVRRDDSLDHVEVGADGVLIGRHGDCDVTLNDGAVSRHHARLYRDPFERWIIEDLGSHNGVWLGRERIEAQAIAPGQPITIGPYTLMIEDLHTQHMPAEEDDFDYASQATLLDDSYSRAELFSKAERDETLSVDRLKQLNELAGRLVNLADPQQLYPAVCEEMAAGPQQVCLALRLPPAEQPLPEAPEALAFCSGGHTPERPPHRLAMHVSRRVLEAVRSTDSAVMAGAATDDGQRMDLTVFDDRKPRAVLAAPIACGSQYVEVLYLDVPADQGSEALLDYVQAVARQVNFARKGLLLAEAKAERATIDKQLEFARQIQQRLTPPRHIQGGGVEVAIHYEPAMWVGGDYCDVVMMEDGRVAWAIGDVSGKGLPAAMVMATLHGALRTALRFSNDLSEAVTGLSSHLVSHTPENMFVTMIAGVFDPANGQLQFVNAGHPPPLLLSTAAGTAEPLGQPANPPVGILDHTYIAEQHELPTGSTLLAVTDGITESAKPSGEMFEESGLQEFAGTQIGQAPESLVKAVADAAEEFRAPLGPQDDTTVFALSRG